jgi:hypothetical protein
MDLEDTTLWLHRFITRTRTRISTSSTIGNPSDPKTHAEAGTVGAENEAITGSYQIEVSPGEGGPVFIQSTNGALEIRMPATCNPGFPDFRPDAFEPFFETDPSPTAEATSPVAEPVCS